MLWLINQATAGNISASGSAPTLSAKKDEKKDAALSTTAGPGASFSDFKIDASA